MTTALHWLAKVAAAQLLRQDVYGGSRFLHQHEVGIMGVHQSANVAHPPRHPSSAGSSSGCAWSER